MKPRLVIDQITLASLIITFLLIIGFITNTYMSEKALYNADHNWCGALELLTEHPVHKPADAKSNPSRQYTYEFYLELKTLETHFGC